jgi:hypothetical protein
MGDDDLVEIPSKVYLRYHRSVQAHPQGEILHHGDCEFFRVKICTCGLLHDLKAVPEEASKIFPHYDQQEAEQSKVIEKLFHP